MFSGVAALELQILLPPVFYELGLQVHATIPNFFL